MEFKVISPIDGSVFIEREYASDANIQSTLKKAKQAQLDWKETPIKQRAKLCLALVDQLLEKKAAIANEICWQMGRPIQYCEGEIAGFAERARYMISIAEDKLKPIEPIAPSNTSQNEYNRYIEREPLGVVLTISPWNYPFLTAVNTIIPALMAGNSVILKPSSQTPLSAERIFEAATSAGIPEGVFSYLFLTHQATEKIVSNDLIDFVSFTGSVNGGQKITAAMNKRFIGLGLELGGKDPAYVRDDANINDSAESLVDGAYFNSGQSCCGVERIYVHQAVYDAFLTKFVDTVKQYCVGNPSDKKTTLGPMVNTRAANLVREQISEALSKGASALIDDADFNLPNAEDNVDDSTKKHTPYVTPQVLVNVNHSMSVMMHESFGPVVGIMKVSSDAEAIDLMNDSEFGLTASVWTNDETAAVDIGRQVNTGTWFMNRCDYLDPALAWVGVKNSGRGCTLSEIGYEQLTRPKSFHLKRLS